MNTKLPKPVRTVTNFEEGCNLAYEAGHPIVAFVTDQQRRYKFFPSRIYKEVSLHSLLADLSHQLRPSSNQTDK